MEAHLHPFGLPSPLQVRRASPCMVRWHPLQHHPLNPLHSSSSKKANELHAQGKGFGDAISSKKSTQGGDESMRRNSNDGREADEEDAIPQVVFDRMMTRIAFYVGFPMASGVGLLYLQSVLKEQRLWDVPAWLPLLTTLLGFGTSALGIAYGTLSSSWNPNKEGSLLGWEEVKKNWPELWKEEENNRR